MLPLASGPVGGEGGTGRILTVGLVDGRTVAIAVSAAAPIVRFVPTTRSAIAIGSAIVGWMKPDGDAALIAVGKGVGPPM